MSSVLTRYPQWRQKVIEAMKKPLFDITYCPEVIEIFDQFGLLAGRVHGCFSYECTRNIEEESEFIAWMLDGELAVFYADSEVLVNRLQLLEKVINEIIW